MFNGRFDAELYREYGRWLPYITDIYMNICDSETGDFRSLPFPGSAIDQPYMSMQIIRLVQMNYRKHLNEKMKKIKSSSARRSRH